MNKMSIYAPVEDDLSIFVNWLQSFCPVREHSFFKRGWWAGGI